MDTRLFFCLLLFMTVESRPNGAHDVDIEKTIAQVEDMIKSNPDLPRLTRSEILELIGEIQIQDSKEAVESTTATLKYDTELSNEIEDIDNDLKFESSNISATIADSYVTTKPEQKYSTRRAPIHTPVTERTQSRVPVTEKNSDKLLVVLPYTNADGVLDELITRPPRVALLRSPSPMQPTSTEAPKKTTRKVINKRRRKPVNADETIETTEAPKMTRATFKPRQTSRFTSRRTSTKKPEKLEKDFSSEIQAFLDNHGLFGNKAGDKYISAGFKPLPTDGTINGRKVSSEKILLWHGTDKKRTKSEVHSFLNNEDSLSLLDLEALASELDPSVQSLNFTDSKTQSSNYEPIDYDAIKVLPLQSGLNPVDSVEDSLEFNVLKRQNDATTTDITSTPDDVPETTTIFTTDSEMETSASEESSNKVDKATPVEAPKIESPSFADLESSFGGPAPPVPGDAELPPARKNGFYFMLDWNSFLEVGTDDNPKYVNIRFEPKIGDRQMFLPVSVP